MIAMETLAKAPVRLFGIEPKDEISSAYTAEEVAHIVGESRREGLIEESRHGLVSKTLSSPTSSLAMSRSGSRG